MVLECGLISENDKGFNEKLHTISSNLNHPCTIERLIFSVADVDSLSDQNRDAVSVIKVISENDKGFNEKLHTISSNLNHPCTIERLIFSVADVDSLSDQNRDAVSVIKDSTEMLPDALIANLLAEV